MHYFNNIANSMDVYHDDFRFLQDYLIDGIQTLYKGLADENFIVSGAEVIDNGDGTVTISKGFVWLDGELLEVPEQTFSYNASSYYVYEKQTSEKPGGERDAAGLIFNPWQLNYAIAVETTVLPPGALDIFGKRLADVIYKLPQKAEPVWETVGDDGGKTTLYGEFIQDTYYPLKWRLTPDNTLQVFGSVKTTQELASGASYFVARFDTVQAILNPDVEGFEVFSNLNLLYGYGSYGFSIGRGAFDTYHKVYLKIETSDVIPVNTNLTFNCQIPVFQL